MDRRRAKRAEHEHRQRCKKHRPCLHPAPYIRKPAQNLRIRRCAAPRQRHAPYGRSVRGDNWGTQPRRNVMKPGERTMSHRGAEVAYLQGESDRARGVTVCLPCRRSWVGVPSSAPRQSPANHGALLSLLTRSRLRIRRCQHECQLDAIRLRGRWFSEPYPADTSVEVGSLALPSSRSRSRSKRFRSPGSPSVSKSALTRAAPAHPPSIPRRRAARRR
jgi:hypothetical protein